MNKNDIKKLDSKLIDQIAAGEVVDCPESVIKELIDNSIDATSTEIKIHLKNAGINQIIVKDNGHGMKNDNLIKCLERFATSKISKQNDLSNISTLGFRGEALPSIASVSKIKIKSLGKSIQNYSKDNMRIVPSDIDLGTEITVSNIFHNIPARKKFLKSEAYEYKRILNTVKRFCIGYPNISFTLTHNNKQVIIVKEESLSSRISSILGNEYKKNLLSIESKKDSISMSGYIGNLSILKKRRGNQFCYINNRYIDNNLINITIRSCYRHLIERAEYPFFAIFLSVPTQMFDVNVHPKKLEVKFTNELKIQYLIKSSVSNVIKNNILKVAPDFYLNKNQGVIESETLPFSRENGTTILNDDFHTRAQVLHHQDDNNTDNEINNVWQLHNKYIITEIKSGLVIIDQHVAHERILYEEAKAALNGEGLNSQKILFPQTLSFETEEFTYLLDLLLYLTKIGFEIRKFGNTSIIVEGVPSELPLGKEKEIIKDILENYMENKRLNSSFIEYMAATYACKAAIKAGESLSQLECMELINTLFNTEHPYYCPHGRPIIVNLTIEDLDKRFERH